MRCVIAAIATGVVVLSYSAAKAEECKGRPNALGVSRVLTVDPTEHRRIGSMQYGETLPLADKEIVLTFDDGPLPAYTASVLETLASECVKATFFMVGKMADAYPEWVRRVYNAGHTVATHTYRHRQPFSHIGLQHAIEEIDGGIVSVETALGDPRALAPFFRFPGLRSTPAVEQYLAERGIMAWSADVPADDWKPISANEVIERALTRLERKGKGVLLLHDIQARTALALPELLLELKARGYRIVHVVPSGPERPKTVTEPSAWVMHRHHPKVLATSPAPAERAPRQAVAAPELPVPSALSFGFPELFGEAIEVATADGEGKRVTISRTALDWRSKTREESPHPWPAVVPVVAENADAPAFSAPGIESIDPSKPLHSGIVQAAVHAEFPSSPAELRSTVVEHHAEDRSRRRRLKRNPRNLPEEDWALRLNWFH
jgi:peptidoglycan/xylan/chitin deacetylase (PgdA/CDA1 family)